MTKLSIITINYNNAEDFRKTIESVISQTFTNFEYIIIDGGSTDGSVDIIKQYNDKITYWVSKVDKGIYNAMNNGILQAKGEYCLFLNSGDYLCNENTLSDIFKKSFDEDIVYGNRINLHKDGKTETRKFTQNLKFSFLFKNALPHQASFIKRELFNKVGLYSENYKYASDWEFYLRALMLYSCSYKYIDENLIYFDLTGISSNPSNWVEMQEERNFILKKLFPLLYDDYVELYELRFLLKKIDKRAETVGKILLYSIRKIRQLLKFK